jgi:hypothetical protein
VTDSASSPQGKREDGTYSTLWSCRRLENKCLSSMSIRCIQVQKELMEKTSLREASRVSFSACRPVPIEYWRKYLRELACDETNQT